LAHPGAGFLPLRRAPAGHAFAGHPLEIRVEALQAHTLAPSIQKLRLEIEMGERTFCAYSFCREEGESAPLRFALHRPPLALRIATEIEGQEPFQQLLHIRGEQLEAGTLALALAPAGEPPLGGLALVRLGIEPLLAAI
jgi:hypothetical protein